MAVEAPTVTLDPEQRAAGDVTHFWRIPQFGGLVCLRATFRRHAYARHTHETYAVAAIVEGCETFYHRGRQHYAEAGRIAVVGPDELHDGEPHGGGFEYRTLYPSVALMREIAAEVGGVDVAPPPFFPDSVFDDRPLVELLTHVHGRLERPDLPLLQRDSQLALLLAELIARYAVGASPRPVGREAGPASRARDYLDAHFAEEIDLATLAAVAGLSRTRLIRAFKREAGLTPHAYLVDRRFRAASRMLGRGEPPAEVAAACGFCDQSHLNRVFKARMAVTPGVYRAV